MASNVINENVIVKEISLKDITAKSVHSKNTMVLELEGPSVHLIDDDILLHVLQVKVGIDREDIKLLYNLGNHSQWYLSLTKEAVSKCHEVLHNMMFTVRDYNFTVTLKHLDVTRTKAFLYYVPPTFTPSDVKKIVQSFANPQTEIEIKPFKGSIWEIDFDPDDMSKIPHYINMTLSEVSKFTMELRIAGRETPCFFCGSYEHESCMCPKSDGTSFLSKNSSSINLKRRNAASNDAWLGQWLKFIFYYLPFCQKLFNATEVDEELPSTKRKSPENKNKKPERRFEFLWEKDIDDAIDENLETVSYGDPAVNGVLKRSRLSRFERNRRTSGVKSVTSASDFGTPVSDAGTPVSLAGSFGYVSDRFESVSEISESAAGASGKNKNKVATRPRTLAIPPIPKRASSMRAERPKTFPESRADSIASELGEAEKLVRPGSFTTSYVQSANTDVAKWVTPTVGRSPSFETIYLTSNCSPITPFSSSYSLNSPNLFPDREPCGSSSTTASPDQAKSVIGRIREYFSGVNKKK